MNPVDKELDMYIKSSIKTPKQIGNVVYVYNGNGDLIERHRAIDLGKAFFTTSNDVFFNIYGFNYVPKGIWWERSKRAAAKM